MNSSQENGITVKLFAGFPLKSEIKMHLEKSAEWKQSRLFIGSDNKEGLIEVHYEGLDYIGRFLGEHKIPLNQLITDEAAIRKSLQNYCPKCNLDKINIRIFPQIFIS